MTTWKFELTKLTILKQRKYFFKLKQQFYKLYLIAYKINQYFYNGLLKNTYK